MLRKGGGSELLSIEENVDESIQVLMDYIRKSKERLITVASNINDNIRINRKKTKP